MPASKSVAWHVRVLEHHLHEAYLAGAPDGRRSYLAVAGSCRGLVPEGTSYAGASS